MKFASLAGAIVAINTFAKTRTTVFASPGSTRSHDAAVQRILEGHGDHDHDHDHDDNEKCVEHEIDFVMVEGDSVRSEVEGEIVEMLKHVGIKVNTRKLLKDDFNKAEQAGDFHLSFSETWGAPYDPHAYASGWVAQDEGHHQALAGLEAPNTRDSLYKQIDDVLQEESHTQRSTKWESIFKVVHDNAVMLPLWGARIPTVLNSKRLSHFEAGNQQYDYPVHKLKVRQGDSTVTIAPGAQTGRFKTVGRLDPHTYRPNEFFANNWVYEGLVKYGAYGQVLPSLAKNWTIAENGAGQRYTFQLRPNVQFHDGEAWDCAAAKLNMDHVLQDPLRTPDYHLWYGLMSQIQNWECASDMELVIDTKGKYYPFLQELSFIRPLRMLSPAAFAGDADPVTSNSCHVKWEPGTITCAGIIDISGTGPFKYVSRTSVEVDGEDDPIDKEVIFARNPGYWDGEPSIEKLIIKHYDSSDEIKAALLDESLDLVWGGGVLPSQDLKELDEDETNNLSVYHSDDINNVMIMLNSGKAPLDDINLRKTVIHAIDKNKIIDHALGGLYKPVDNVFPNDAPYCDVSLTPRWDYDLEKAEFLNCPKGSDKSLALGLGLGLGFASLVLLGVSGVYIRRSRKLETDLENLLRNEKAAEA